MFQIFGDGRPIVILFRKDGDSTGVAAEQAGGGVDMFMFDMFELEVE